MLKVFLFISQPAKKIERVTLHFAEYFQTEMTIPRKRGPLGFRSPGIFHRELYRFSSRNIHSRTKRR